MKKIVLSISGASGSIYAKRLMELLEDQPVHVDVVMSRAAVEVWRHELDEEPDVPFRLWERMDFSAPFASGSAGYDAMLIVPCSMGTIGRIAAGISNDLSTRAADVMLKERRTLICMPRETPLSQIHLENMLRLTQTGAIILPASPSFYAKPEQIEQLIDSVLYRILQLLELKNEGFRWGS